MSCLARMLYMHSMISYSVRRGSVQRPSLEDSTEEPKTNSAVASGRWEGPISLLVEYIKNLHCSCIIHACVHASVPGHTCMRHANRRGPCRITCRAPAGVRAFSFRSKWRSLDPRIAIFITLNSCKDPQRGCWPEKKNVQVGDADAGHRTAYPGVQCPPCGQDAPGNTQFVLLVSF
jgi:hypothetical protein